MKATSLGDDSSVLVFDKGEEIVKTLTEYVTARRISAAHFTAIGAQGTPKAVRTAATCSKRTCGRPWS